MDLSELDYDLPPELIAQDPAERRDGSRLLVYERATSSVRHRTFDELPEELQGELVVVNDTKVVPARIPIETPRGEVLLLERLDDGTWEALARPTRRLRAGRRYGPVELLEQLGEGRWRLRLEGEPAGETPLPPYITKPLADPSRYQTVYARTAGSAAAPTAGLHFTPELLAQLEPVRVTLHVGLDTFRPVTEERLEEHRIHGERYEVEPEAWERIRAAERVLAVGTTTVRVLETLARDGPL
ncbi:MAG TPA: S-adenosylmethionine:tRNA ribosyltransferase-isomerase, partial [Gaiellaceae bacterium]